MKLNRVVCVLAVVASVVVLIGFPMDQPVGNGGGSTDSNGNAKVQTFAWASWVQPGIYARPNGGTVWALQDIHGLRHERAATR